MKRILFILFFISGATMAQAQQRISTAMPFLRIAPDARGTALGETGIGTAPDVNAQFWNPAKYSFCANKSEMALNYASAMSKSISGGGFNGYLSGYYKVDDLQTIGASVRYFSYGDAVSYMDDHGEFTGSHEPREFAIDASYSRKLSEHFSTAVAFRYMKSDIVKDFTGSGNKAAQAVAADIAVYYQKPVFNDYLLGAGVNVSNIGTKVSYNSNGREDFLPMNLGFGASLGRQFNELNKLTLSVDVNKLLVPTPPVYDANGVIVSGKDPGKSVIGAAFSSFFDTPGGYKEECKEFTPSVGLEYNYGGFFSARGGYTSQAGSKGAYKAFTAGVGLVYQMLDFNMSYSVPVGNEIYLSSPFKLSVGMKLK